MHLLKPAKQSEVFDAVVSSLSGEVWMVEGLAGNTLTWHRFATGLYQPMGIKVVDGLVESGHGFFVALHAL